MLIEYVSAGNSGHILFPNMFLKEKIPHLFRCIFSRILLWQYIQTHWLPK